MKALTIHQPWADAIAYGHKPVENRSWPTSYRGPLLIHAGLTWSDDGAAFIRRMLPAADAEALITAALKRRGGYVGRAILSDCVRNFLSPWFVGPRGFVLTNAEAFPAAVPARGHQGLFHVPQDVCDALPLPVAKGEA
ncbi:ASCH domain-containing protein [Nisaea sediminum]|uniref:ASCH domain-containing protein n=1 Tax=Nisaea sediminum TaxID=2775867 RepID=UPI00186630D8|nr:ASCH domain-containing protein [Nisaea sediminum]